ncbi:MAG TPA: acyl-CoA dehydrogenase family protein [Candidatus Limnocylindria bacterium]|jgi:acyl-CoA dehydrogenase|nr:acyl-CoA dehydrogenase family protein [Candidatus Limnocylindria bacterium]
MAATAPPRHHDPFALTEEERAVRDTAAQFAARELAPTVAQRDEEERYDRSLFDRMGELGLTGLPYPEEFGGAGMGTFPWVLACEELAVADMGMAVSLSVHVLAQLCIYSAGSDEQKARFLPQMTAGRQLGAFALTEPQAGSDASAIALRAERDGDDYLLTGSKVWITNGADADVVVVFATLDRALGRDGITAFVVERDTPGFRVGAHERKMGIRDSVSVELIFDGARVRAANRLGEEGKGLKVALGSLGAGRISIAACCVGVARAALEHAARYATQRSQFGRPIAEQEMVQAMLADAATAVDAARLLTWRAARLRDAGQPINAASSMAKLFASDTAMRVATDAVQIYGGAGYSRDNPVERFMRDAKGAQIYEGTNQIHRLIVAQQLIDEVRRTG